jgi:spore maturation protein A
MALWRKLNFDKFCAKKLSFAIKKIFPDETDDCYDDLAVNLSANLLGLGSAGTPAGISATKKFRSKKNKIMLLVINSCSIQLIPTTIVALRSTYSATEDIILPTLISTIIGVFVGGLLVKITVKK